MSNDFWSNWSVPIVAVGFGAISLFIAWFGSWSFDRRYGRTPKSGA